jgi:hypothetical protein
MDYCDTNMRIRKLKLEGAACTYKDYYSLQADRQQQFLYKEQILNFLYTLYLGMSKQDDLHFLQKYLL